MNLTANEITAMRKATGIVEILTDPIFDSPVDSDRGRIEVALDDLEEARQALLAAKAAAGADPDPMPWDPDDE